MKCNYVTHMRARYTKHVKYHTMPMIKCADCDFRTPYKWNLDRHNRNHSTTAPGTYKCSHCSFSADIKQSLTVHETNHHVPPVGGVFPVAGANRRRYRVGASDAPGSSVDGTEIVTYETTKEDGIVEILTETKSAMPTVNSSCGPTFKTAVSKADAKKTAAPGLKTVKAMNVTEPGGRTDAAAGPEKPRRRPLPQLIPIDPQQSRNVVPVAAGPPRPASARADGSRDGDDRGPEDDDGDDDDNDDNDDDDDDNDNDDMMIDEGDDGAENDESYYSAVAGRSALSDFASLIDDRDAENGGRGTALENSGPARPAADAATPDRRRSDSSSAGGSSASGSASFKSKLPSFFDHMKARVDSPVDLKCRMCQHESKCLTEFIRHQLRFCVVTGVGGTQQPPLMMMSTELKSTRCQRCRKRCKTSAELVTHLATCRGSGAAPAAAAASSSSSSSGPGGSAVAPDTDGGDPEPGRQHPMENKIFVWNTAAVPAPVDDGTSGDGGTGQRDSAAVVAPEVPSKIPNTEPSSSSEPERQLVEEDDNEEFPAPVAATQEQQHVARKEGKMYKTVFKCPHCTFWAATASRFHVHIVGHLNRKPFECSCCAYRSNWRWDITKHIRLKSARRSGSEEMAVVANSHQGAKVLMTDETGRRNYSKYNRYLTVMEMDIADGADRAAGGDCEDGKGVTSKKVVGGGVVRKRRVAGLTNNCRAQVKQMQLQVAASMSGATPAAAKKSKASANANRLLQQLQPPSPTPPPSSSPSSSLAGSDNRSKTVWKCKKCFFRDCDRLTVLNHVKAHYRRGEFNGSGASKQSLSTNNQKSNIKKTVESKETAEQKTLTTDRRKTKTPTTGSTTDTLLLLSTNPKSFMLYNDENFLSCPLCDVVAGSSGQLKDHMESTHIPEETKYRCEYCPFWSEEKKAMLDHMIFAHEMDDGGLSIDVNTVDMNNQARKQDKSSLNHEDVDDITQEDDEEIQSIDETVSSYDSTEVFNNSNHYHNKDTTNTPNMEMIFDTSDENIVVETIECKPDFGDEEKTVEMPSTPRKNLEKGHYDIKNDENQKGDEEVEEEENILETNDTNKQSSATIKIVKTVTTPTSTVTSAELPSGRQILYECIDCWYFSTNKKDMSAHKQLHVKRGGLYSCSQCTFNVTKSAILYHHYRYGHVIEEPELRYPEDSVVRAGQREIIFKNSADKKEEDKVPNTVDGEDIYGPPLVWSYNQNNTHPFNKVFKCRYCPHTNRRRHNTVEHERMHSDHPEHQSHRQQQQRAAGSSVTAFPLHPCKRCTYVCNNAGVLASHVKVHSIMYSSCTVGFYDVTIIDAMQIRALEYIMALENNLILDKGNSKSSSSDHQNSMSDDSDNSNGDNPEITRYFELDNPKLKFCKYCPARFFFRSDLKCHIQFHKFRNWSFTCDCCSFAARDKSHITSHEIVHRDEYTQRTAELLATGYSVSQRYPRPSEYPASVSDSPPQLSTQSPKYENVGMLESADNQRQLRIKRPRYCELDGEQLQEDADKSTKRRRRSTLVAKKINSANVEPSSLPPKTEVPAKKTISSIRVKIDKTTVNNTKLPSKDLDDNDEISDHPKEYMCKKCPCGFFLKSHLFNHTLLHGSGKKYKCPNCDFAVDSHKDLVEQHEWVHKFKHKRHRKKTKLSLKENTTKTQTETDDATTMPAPPPPPPPPPSSSIKRMTPILNTINDNNYENNDDNGNDGLSMSANEEDLPLDPEFGTTMLGNPSFYYPTTIKNGVARPKRYKCPKCPSAFDKRDQYVIHLTLHGARDKYQCDKCDYSVRYTANYVQHQRKHAQDAEMRKNHEQAADRAKFIAAQEEAANASRRNRPSANANQKKHNKLNQQPLPEINLDMRKTVFRNEISDRQTAYELNAAYGATGLIPILGVPDENSTALFRCTQCPFECYDRSLLDEHLTHHTNAGGDVSAPIRVWKHACRFCSYRSSGPTDLAEHTRVHFLRGTGAVLASIAAVATTGVDSDDAMEPSDHIEYHGKRVVYQHQQRRRRRRRAHTNYNDEKSTGSEDIDSNSNASYSDGDPEEEEPFSVFKDRGDGIPSGRPGSKEKISRFSPDIQQPNVLIDFNDNRTDSTISSKPQQYPPPFVRFINNGKRLEFVSSRSEIVQPDSPIKKKKNKN